MKVARACCAVAGTLVVSALCSVALATPPRSPITLELKLGGLEQGGTAGDITIHVSSVMDAPGTRVTLMAPPGMEIGQTEWLVDLEPGQPVTLITTWALTGGSGNMVVSARAKRAVGPGESWGDMQSIPLHAEAKAGATSDGWLVDQVPVGSMEKAGDAPILSSEPTLFRFPDLSSAPPSAMETWPATDLGAPGASPPVGAATVTLTGHWGYPDRSGVIHNVDQQLLEIRRGDGAALSPRVFCFTDTAGSFSCSFPHPGTSFRVWLRSWTNINPGPTRLGVFSGIEVSGGCGSDAIDCTYANSTPEVFCADGATCNVGSWNVPTGAEPWLGAHQMTQDLIRSWKRSVLAPKDPPGTHGGPAKITYPVPPTHGIHCHAGNEGSENSGDPWISIRPPFQTAPDVVLHEYGHAVMDNMWYALTPNWTNDDCPSPHYISGISGAGCALSEGFANFWSWYSNELYDGDAVPGNNGPVYDDPGFSVNFETRDNGTFQNGPLVEGNVAAVFGDILDAANEGPPPGTGAADRLSDGLNHVWHTLYSQSLPHMGNWYVAYWSTYGHDPGPVLEILFQNTINYGFVLNDTCVNARVIMGTSFSDAVDTSSATTDSTDPVVSCGNGTRGKSVFYRWTAPGPGTVTANTFGSSYDTILSVYGGACGSASALACNDDTGGLQSQVSLTVGPGDTLLFMVSAYQNDGGSLAFHLGFVPDAPANDACATPVVVSTTPFTHTAYTFGATITPGDPAPACGNGSNTKNVWYRYTAPANGTLTADTMGSSYDTILAAYSGACGGLTPLPGGCSNDLSPPATWSGISVAVTSGTTYLIQVSALKNDGGTLVFHLGFTPGPPANDNCTGAFVLQGGSTATSENTSGATNSPGDPAPACGNGSSAKNVWFQYLASASGTLTVHTLGSSYDTILAGYTGACGGLAPIAGGCNDDFSPPQRWSRIDIPVTAGGAYVFQVSAYNNDGGVLALAVEFVPPPPPNDVCSAATPVGSYPFNDVRSTLGATASPGDPAPACGNGSNSHSVWYLFTAPSSGLLHLDSLGSNYDTILSAWDGTCGSPAMAGCNDDAGGGTHSELDLAVIAGQTLRVMVSSYAATGGDLDFLLDFLPDAGHVPDGGLFPGTPLDITDAGGGALRLVWSASCVTTDVDYEVYEGALGSFYSHGPIVCSTQGATAATIVPAPYDTYYLVVPANLRREGSYGLDSSGVERPAGARGCLPQAIGVCSASLTARQE